MATGILDAIAFGMKSTIRNFFSERPFAKVVALKFLAAFLLLLAFLGLPGKSRRCEPEGPSLPSAVSVPVSVREVSRKPVPALVREPAVDSVPAVPLPVQQEPEAVAGPDAPTPVAEPALLAHWLFEAESGGGDGLRMRSRSTMESPAPIIWGERWTLTFRFRQERIPHVGGARSWATGPMTLSLPGRPGRTVSVHVPGAGSLSGRRVSAGDWEHVAIVATPAHAALFINGLQADQQPMAADRARPAQGILRFRSDARQAFEGLLQDVRLYGEALSPERIADLAQGVYHPKAAWLEDCAPATRALVQAGNLSRARLTTLEKALGSLDSDTALARLAASVEWTEADKGLDAQTPGDLPAWREERLTSASARRMAAWALGVWAHEPAAEPLLGALDEDDTGLVRAAALATERLIEAQGERDDADDARLLRRMAAAPCGRIRAQALTVLRETGRGGEDDFARGVSDADWRVRTVAARALADTGAALVPVREGPESDWPTWRREPGRGAATPHAPSLPLHLHWTLELPPPRRAWPAQADDFDKLEFDLAYEPVVAGNKVFIGSMTEDSVIACDLDSGLEQWRFVADGPVRVPPAVWEGRVYAASDDGLLYCLDAETGRKLWAFRAAPSERRVLGNRRLISVWPARGGPAVVNGTVYFAAGLWPFEGVFVAALDARDGSVRWMNSATGSQMDLHQHGGAYAFGGVAPQGSLAADGNRLFVPGGRTPPAVFDRRSGELLFFRHDSGTVGKGAGGYRVYARDGRFLNPAVRRNRLYNAEDGAPLFMLDADVLAEGGYFGVENERVFVWSSDKAGDERRESEPVEDLERLHLLADRTLYGSGYGGKLFALELGTEPDPLVAPVWEARVDGPVFRMIAARGRLLVSTETGRLHCFGPDPRRPIARAHPADPEPLPEPAARWADATAALAERRLASGTALLFGIGSGQLLDALLARTDLHVTAFDPDAAIVDRFRQRYSRKGLYGKRVAVHRGDATSLPLPPYIADAVFSEDAAAAGSADPVAMINALCRLLRPYGGRAFLCVDDAELRMALAQAARETAPTGVFWDAAEDGLALIRPGALPGATDWTHQYGNAANAAYAADALVKPPLGMVWFGSTSNEKTLPRHLNGPIPQIVRGRLVLLGLDHISARCVYTGRELWATELPLIGAPFTSLEHEFRPAPVYFPNHPGANFIGSPYVSAPDSVYALYEDQCLHLDLETGRKQAVIAMPDRDRLPAPGPDTLISGLKESYAARVAEGRERRWGHVAVEGDLLLAGAYPHMFDNRPPGRAGNWNATSSEWLVAFDRHSGAVRWTRQARYGFRHNAIAASGDRVYVMDNLSEEILGLLRRRGIRPDTRPAIYALDASTGEPVWRYDAHVFGTWLSYSAEHDVLMQAGRAGGRGTPGDEPSEEILALRGRDGAKLWRRPARHTGPIALHDALRRVIAGRDEDALDLLTGEPVRIPHPMTGQPEPWRFNRTYGCGTQVVGRHLVTFRSGAAGYYDLLREGGTGNIGGVRSGCTSSLIPAGGLLNAPDYTRSCSCSYQHQTSLALAHMPDVEMWTYTAFSDPEPGAVRQVALNLGAPGSRRADDGTLWINWPSVPRVSGPDTSAELSFDGEPEWFHVHALLAQGTAAAPAWVAASGVRGLRELRLRGLARDGNATYAVRFVFAEPDGRQTGERVFDIALQGQTIVENFDIAARAGAANFGFAAEILGIAPDEAGEIVATFTPQPGSLPPTLSGVVARLE